MVLHFYKRLSHAKMIQDINLIQNPLSLESLYRMKAINIQSLFLAVIHMCNVFKKPLNTKIKFYHKPNKYKTYRQHIKLDDKVSK